MFSFIISIPFWVYLLLFFIVLGVSVYSYHDMKSKYHDNPMVWIIPFLLLTLSAFVAYKYAIDFTSNLLFQQISNIVTLVFFVMFILSFVITFAIAHKKNYTDKMLEKKAIPVAVVSFGIAILSLVLLLVMDRFF